MNWVRIKEIWINEIWYETLARSDFLDRLGTRLVVPLMPLARYGTPIERLNPRFEIEGEVDFMIRGF